MKKLIKASLVAMVLAGTTFSSIESSNAGWFRRRAINQNNSQKSATTIPKIQRNLPQKYVTLNQKLNSEPGTVYSDNASFIGFSNGIDDAQTKKFQGATNPFGETYDHVLSSNWTGNKILNSINCVASHVGVPFVGIGDQEKGIKKLIISDAWCHSQGGYEFINLANAGQVKAETLHLIAPPMADGPGYLLRVKAAAIKAGVKEIKIYQNIGEKKSFKDNDHVTTTPLPHLQLIKPDSDNVIGFGFKIPIGKDAIKISWNKFYTSSGNDATKIKGGIKFNEYYGVPKAGHSLEESYHQNILSVHQRYNPSTNQLNAFKNNPSTSLHGPHQSLRPQNTSPLHPPTNSGKLQNRVSQMPGLIDSFKQQYGQGNSLRNMNTPTQGENAKTHTRPSQIPGIRETFRQRSNNSGNRYPGLKGNFSNPNYGNFNKPSNNYSKPSRPSSSRPTFSRPSTPTFSRPSTPSSFR